MKSNLVKSLMIVLSLMSFQLQVNAGGGSQGPGKEGSVFLQIGHNKPTVDAVEDAEQICREKILEMHVKSIHQDIEYMDGNPEGYTGNQDFFRSRNKLNKINTNACWAAKMDRLDRSKDSNVFDSISGFTPNPKINPGYIIINGTYDYERYNNRCTYFDGNNEWYQLVSNTIPDLFYTIQENWTIDPQTGQPSKGRDLANNLEVVNATGVNISFYNKDAYDKFNIKIPVFEYPRSEYVQCLKSELTKK